MSSAVKFGRHYQFVADRKSFSQPLVIKLPFTLEFDINRDNLAGVNYARITIYNLSPNHRNQLWYDQFTYDTQNPINVTLFAGYGDGPQWPLIFSGNVTRGWSYRQGTDFLTVMECFDGGLAFQNATTNRVFSSDNGNLTQQQVLQTIVSDLAPYGISQGVLSSFSGSLARGVSYSGQTVNILREITNGNFFIDNAKANILLPTDAIGGNQVLINGASGLLDTPIKQNQLVTFKILFEPRLVVGSIVNVQSSTASVYNGLHKVTAFHHRGIISQTVSGEAVTELSCLTGSFNEVGIPTVTP